MNVLELKGFNSYRALNAFHALMLGIKMLPNYQLETYEEFYSRVSKLTSEAQEQIIREAALFVELNRNEVEALICFCPDANGIAYQPANLNNLTPDQIFECIVAVCVEISKIKIDIITDEQKKKSKTFLWIFGEFFQSILNWLSLKR